MRSESTSHPKHLMEAASNTTAAFVKGEPFPKARWVEGEIFIKGYAFHRQAQSTKKLNIYYKILHRSCSNKLKHTPTYSSQRLSPLPAATGTAFLLPDWVSRWLCTHLQGAGCPTCIPLLLHLHHAIRGECHCSGSPACSGSAAASQGIELPYSFY